MPGPGLAAKTALPAAPAGGGRRLWRTLRIVFSGMALGLLLAAGGEVGRVLLGTNFHTVLPGQVYRCAQLSAGDLEPIIRAYNIRTVVNLRGACAPIPWYMEECRLTHRLNVAQEDICFSAGRLPPATELRRLVEVFDRSERPLLLHCRRGADRTGLASAIVLLLKTDVGLDRACRQLGLRYGHVALGRPAYLDRFFTLYRGWLQRQGRAHSPETFREWVQHGYCAGECQCLVEPIDWAGWVPRGRASALRMRVRNVGRKTWHFQPEVNAGFHLRYVLWDALDQQVAAGRAGLFHEDVAPGETIELSLAVPPLKKAGKYRLMVDMADEPHCWFYQLGSEPLERELEVRE